MKRPKVLRPDLWPQADRIAWATAFVTGDPFDDQGPAAHWRTRSRRSVASGYGRWIGWNRDNDPEALKLLPADRLPARGPGIAVLSMIAFWVVNGEGERPGPAGAGPATTTNEVGASRAT